MSNRAFLSRLWAGSVTAPDNFRWLVAAWLWFGLLVLVELRQWRPQILVFTLFRLLLRLCRPFVLPPHRRASLVAVCVRYTCGRCYHPDSLPAPPSPLFVMSSRRKRPKRAMELRLPQPAAIMSSTETSVL
jgi:hypothetical protein